MWERWRGGGVGLGTGRRHKEACGVHGWKGRDASIGLLRMVKLDGRQKWKSEDRGEWRGHFRQKKALKATFACVIVVRDLEVVGARESQKVLCWKTGL
jgi:hypothetical protein